MENQGRLSESRSIAMVLLCLAGLLCTSQARAQDERSREGRHRFSFLMLGASVGSGPADDFKKALMLAGFGDEHHWPGGSVRPGGIRRGVDGAPTSHPPVGDPGPVPARWQP